MKLASYLVDANRIMALFNPMAMSLIFLQKSANSTQAYYS
jgi:hypothetical protein